MSLIMQIKQELRLQVLQELKLDLRLQLMQPVLELVPPEFKGYINIEEDEDVELLMESLPFLVLHEYSHPLQDAGRLVVPKKDYGGELDQVSEYDLSHDANETGIDKGSLLVGAHIDQFSPDQMFYSYAKMAERVFRDHLTDGREPLTLVARLYAGLNDNLTHTKGRRLVEHQRNLIARVDRVVTDSEFNAIAEFYQEVYKGTVLAVPYQTPGSGKVTSTFLKEVA